jgi:hypothetical protein
VKLASVSELRASISGRDNIDSSALYETTLRQVTLALETILNTKFSRVTQQRDIFFIDPNERGYQTGFLKLVLKTGLIDLTPAVVDPLVQPPLAVIPPMSVYLAYDHTTLATAESVDLSGVIVDPDRGFLTVLGGSGENKYAVVHYNSGFTTLPDEKDVDNFSPVYQNIPEWLHTAALAYGYEAFQSMRTWSNDTSRAAYKAVSGSRTPVNPPSILPPPSTGVISMLRPYLRNSSVGVYPLN